MKKIFTTKYFFLAYFMAIVLLVVLPLNTTESLNTVTIISFRGDYFFHVLAFIPWACFGLMMQRRKVSWFFLGILLATFTEGLQYVLPYRAFNINDLISNSIGIVAGFIIFIPVFSFLKHFKKSPR